MGSFVWCVLQIITLLRAAGAGSEGWADSTLAKQPDVHLCKCVLAMLMQSLRCTAAAPCFAAHHQQLSRNHWPFLDLQLTLATRLRGCCFPARYQSKYKVSCCCTWKAGAGNRAGCGESLHGWPGKDMDLHLTCRALLQISTVIED